ncbi:TonB-dependent receptor [Dyadobacter luteus]|uniref:TonB-dependent receptor n=1 Tax=Dyadobacter luteus TaxID=2259619 RepID=A0A3D8YAT7_9BACT|nr:TonB-dependent receptor [Dyadobacter luteus]REA60920.1 TonB-dependent receptor [Dyadobacter luteus]
MNKLVLLTAAMLIFTFKSNAQEVKDSLEIRSLELQEVVIGGVVETADISSEFSSRMPITSLENPQLSHTVSGKLLRNRNYFVQYNMLSNITGVTPSWAGASPNYTIRGFRTRSNFRNGLNGYVASDIDPSNIAQLDVVKGPSGALFASSMTVFGGLINRITVKPQHNKFATLFFAGGNNNYQRATVDVNLPLSVDRSKLFRVTGAYTNKESFQDQGLYRNLFLAPSFAYKVNKNLKIEAEGEILRRVATNNPLFIPMNPSANGEAVQVGNTTDLKLDYNKSFTDNSVLFKTTAINFYGKISYRLSDRWSAETNLISNNSQSHGDYQTMVLTNNNSSVIRRVVNYGPESIISQQIQQNLRGDFYVGRVRNRLLAGLDYYRYSYGTTANGLDGSRANGAEGAVRPVFDTVAVHGNNPAYGLFNAQQITSRLAGRIPAITLAVQNSYSAYVSDVINPTEALSIMISARIDRLVNQGTYNKTTNATTGDYNQTAFSPKLGVTYQVLPQKLALFASYMNGFQNVAPTSQVDGTISNFRPQLGNQLEAGVKVELAKKLLEATLSYYHIQVSNVVRSNPENVSIFIQDGRQRSRGLEADLQSAPLQGLFLHAGFAYNDSKLTVADANTQGLRPVNSGPALSGNWYINYMLKGFALKGLSAGLGGNHYGKDVIINSRSAGQFYTNAYSLINAQISYDQTGYALALSADNLLNTKYYYGGRGFVTPGNLRQVILSLKLKL